MTVLAHFRLIIFRTGMAVKLMLLRLQPTRDLRHSVCLGASSQVY